MKTSVVIPNWKGRELLEKNLPSVVACGFDEIIVVDDASPDDSNRFLKENYPQVKILRHSENKGFIRSVNDGFSTATGDVVILLNTDVTPRKGLKEEVIRQFKDPGIFAVSFNEEVEWGGVRGVFYKGLVEHRPGGKPHGAVESFWASGGSAAYDRKKWLELGGMRKIYHPFYWEDLDIGYRAWKRGWRILWDYNARALHKHGSTIKKNFPKKKVDWVVKRNQILFFWININDLSMWFFHLLWLPLRMLSYGYFIPVLWAILKIPKVLVERLKYKRQKLSDEETFRNDEQVLNKFRD